MTTRAEIITSLKKRENPVYSDFKGSFLPHPDNKQLVKVKDDAAIMSALRNIILTDKFERPMNPNFGCNIKRYLFENIDEVYANSIKDDIRANIAEFEPRVNILDIKLVVYERTMVINLFFTTRNSEEPKTLVVSMKRVR